MNQIELIEQQCALEERFARRHLDRKIRAELEQCPVIAQKVREGTERLRNWIQGDYYPSKNARLQQLTRLDLEALVFEIYVGIAYFSVPTLYTNVVGQMAGRLGWDEKRDAITTMGEILAILALTDVFDIFKDGRQASLQMVSNILLSDQLMQDMENVQYLPPMLCNPKELMNNRESGHLTFNDSLILGQGNHHEGNLCLDVLNKMNAVQLKLDTQFLCTVEEDPNTEFTVEKIKDKALEKGKILTDAEAIERVEMQKENWKRFKSKSYEMYSLIARCGNTFHLTHKTDKRGRIYSQGYHLNTQGTSFKKACIEFAQEELVDVPKAFRQ